MIVLNEFKVENIHIGEIPFYNRKVFGVDPPIVHQYAYDVFFRDFKITIKIIPTLGKAEGKPSVFFDIDVLVDDEKAYSITTTLYYVDDILDISPLWDDPIIIDNMIIKEVPFPKEIRELVNQDIKVIEQYYNEDLVNAVLNTKDPLVQIITDHRPFSILDSINFIDFTLTFGRYYSVAENTKMLSKKYGEHIASWFRDTLPYLLTEDDLIKINAQKVDENRYFLTWEHIDALIKLKQKEIRDMFPTAKIVNGYAGTFLSSLRPTGIEPNEEQKRLFRQFRVLKANKRRLVQPKEVVISRDNTIKGIMSEDLTYMIFDISFLDKIIKIYEDAGISLEEKTLQELKQYTVYDEPVLFIFRYDTIYTLAKRFVEAMEKAKINKILIPDHSAPILAVRDNKKAKIKFVALIAPVAKPVTEIFNTDDD